MAPVEAPNATGMCYVKIMRFFGSPCGAHCEGGRSDNMCGLCRWLLWSQGTVQQSGTKRCRHPASSRVAAARTWVRRSASAPSSAHCGS